jgi:hypothetical protein
LLAQRLYFLPPRDFARAARDGFKAGWHFNHNSAAFRTTHIDPAHDFITRATATEAKAGLVIDLANKDARRFHDFQMGQGLRACKSQ